VQNEDAVMIEKLSSLTTESSMESSYVSGTTKNLKSKNKEFSSANNFTSSPTPTKRRKKRNKNLLMSSAAEYGCDTADLQKAYLKDLTMVERQLLANLLDVGFGANWKQIAYSFGMTQGEIKAIENVVAARATSPTEALFQLLLTRLPRLKLEELREKSHKIARKDVVDAINTLMK